MKNIHSKTIGQAWIQYLQTVYEMGNLYYDEDEEIIEFENIILDIEDDVENDLILNTYADEHISSLYMKKMQSTELVEELNASYGKRIFDQLGINQYEWVVNRLKNKSETKAATISLLLPNDPGPRIPCLDIIDFKVRNGKLYTKTFFRSQNALRAYGNLKAIFWLSNKLAKELEIERKNLICFISNGHFNKSDIKKVEDILKNF
ncbi:hypothetical protein I3900191A7_22940 [Clostridium baratii]|uniref:thymidylate synthase n=1 Tax=Clostridium baratii TaxID=1561 RepID=UPI0036F2F753